MGAIWNKTRLHKGNTIVVKPTKKVKTITYVNVSKIPPRYLVAGKYYTLKQLSRKGIKKGRKVVKHRTKSKKKSSWIKKGNWWN
jgi:hypothetical protein